MAFTDPSFEAHRAGILGGKTPKGSNSSQSVSGFSDPSFIQNRQRILQSYNSRKVAPTQTQFKPISQVQPQQTSWLDGIKNFFENLTKPQQPAQNVPMVAPKVNGIDFSSPQQQPSAQLKVTKQGLAQQKKTANALNPVINAEDKVTKAGGNLISAIFHLPDRGIQAAGDAIYNAELDKNKGKENLGDSVILAVEKPLGFAQKHIVEPIVSTTSKTPVLRDAQNVTKGIFTSVNSTYLGSSQKVMNTLKTKVKVPTDTVGKVEYSIGEVAGAIGSFVAGGAVLDALKFGRLTMPVLFATLGQTSLPASTTAKQRIEQMPVDLLAGFLFSVIPVPKGLLSKEAMKSAGLAGVALSAQGFVDNIIQGMNPKDAAKAAATMAVIGSLLHISAVATGLLTNKLIESKYRSDKVDLTPQDLRSQVVNSSFKDTKAGQDLINLSLKAEEEGKNVRITGKAAKKSKVASALNLKTPHGVEIHAEIVDAPGRIGTNDNGLTTTGTPAPITPENPTTPNIAGEVTGAGGQITQPSTPIQPSQNVPDIVKQELNKPEQPNNQPQNEPTVNNPTGTTPTPEATSNTGANSITEIKKPETTPSISSESVPQAQDVLNRVKAINQEKSAAIVNDAMAGKLETQRLTNESQLNIAKTYKANNLPKDATPNTTVTIYRTSKAGEIKPGDHVTLDRENALRYQSIRQGAQISELHVLLRDLIRSGGLHSEFIYAPESAIISNNERHSRNIKGRQGLSQETVKGQELNRSTKKLSKNDTGRHQEAGKRVGVSSEGNKGIRKEPKEKVTPEQQQKDLTTLERYAKQYRTADAFVEAHRLGKIPSHPFPLWKERKLVDFWNEVTRTRTSPKIPASITDYLKNSFGKTLETTTKSELTQALQENEGEVIPYSPTDNILKKVASEIKGFVNPIDNGHENLFYGGITRNILTDGYLLIQDPSVAKKLNAAYVAKLVQKETRDLVKNGGMTFSEAEKDARERVIELIKNADNFPDISKVVPENPGNQAYIQGYTNFTHGSNNVVILSDGQQQVTVNADKFAFMQKNLPNTKLYIISNTRPVSFVRNGKTVGVLMPVTSDEIKIKPTFNLPVNAKVSQAQNDIIGYDKIKEANSDYYNQVQEAGRKNNTSKLQGRKDLLNSPLKVIFKKEGQLKFPNTEIKSPADIAWAFQDLRNNAVESFYVIGLKDNKPVSVEFLTLGTINSSLVDPYEITELLKRKNVDSAYLLHNHPSGDPTPSDADIRVQSKVIEGFKELGVDIEGQVIINSHKYGFIKPDGSHEVYALADQPGKGVKVPVYRKYTQWLEDKPQAPVINQPLDIVNLAKGATANWDKNEMIVYLNTRNIVMGIDIVPKDATDIQKIVKGASKFRGKQIILVNHIFDELALQKLHNKLKLLDIQLLDAVNTDKNGFQSATNEGMLFENKAKYNEGENLTLFPEMNKVGNPNTSTSFASQKKYAQLPNRTKEEQQNNTPPPHEPINMPTPNIIEFPEMVRMTRELTGKVPEIKKFVGFLQGRTGTNGFEIKVQLAQTLFSNKDLTEKAKTLSHELGHVIDLLPEGYRKRSNLLGRIASLNNFLKHTLKEFPDSIDNSLTAKDRQNIMKRARQLAKEPVTVTEKVKTGESSITPNEVLAIWNDITAAYKDPELLSYIQGLDSNQKADIVRQAMKGKVADWVNLKRGQYKEITHDVIKNAPEDIRAMYRKLVKEEILARRLHDLETIKDELWNVSKKWSPLGELRNFPKYIQYRKSSPELYADAISVLFNDPVMLKQEAPNFWRAFFNYIDQKPEAKDNLFKLYDLLNSGEESVFKARDEELSKGFQRGEETFAVKELEKQKRQSSLMYQLKLLFDDKNTPIIDKLKKAQKQGKEIASKDNPVFALKGLNYSDGKLANYIEDKFQPIFATAQSVPDGWNQLGKMLFFERVIHERGDLANPQGYDPHTAQQQLDYMKRTIPESDWNKLQGAIAKFREAVQESIDYAEKHGFYSPELIKQMKANPAYASYQVVDYLDTYISPHAYQSVGTLKDIANPATSTVMKLISLRKAIERNDAKKVNMKFLQDHFPESIKQAKTKWNGHSMSVVDSNKPEEGLVRVVDDGKPTGYYVERDIADTLNYVDNKTLQAVARISRLVSGAPIYRGLFTTFNFGFQTFNFVRDFMRYWKNVPDYSLGQALTSFPRALVRYVQATPHAAREALGMKDTLISEMENAKILGTTFNQAYKESKVNETTQIERVLQKHGILEVKNRKRVVVAVEKALDTLTIFGDFIERLPKIAGYIELKGKMPEEELAQFIRTSIGSPDFRTGGRVTPITNSIFMFSNAIKEGMKTDAAIAFRKNPSRAGFWWKTLLSNFLPKFIMAAIAFGFLGKELKQQMDNVSEYDKTNYTIIPLGLDKNGKTVYIRVPQDETGRFMGGLLWKIMTINHDKTSIESFFQLFAFNAGQLPNLTPLITGGGALLDYLSGNNPYDSFRGKNVIPDTTFKAGFKASFPVMFNWFIHNQGFDVVVPSYTPDASATNLEKTLNYAVISNILGRWVKVSDYGKTEQLQEISNQQTQQQAQKTLAKQQAVDDAVKKFQQGKGSRSQIERELVKQVIGTPKSSADRTARTNLIKAFRIQTLKNGASPEMKSLIYAQTNAEKVQLLQRFQKTMDKASFNKLVGVARTYKVISNSVIIDYRNLNKK